MKQRMIASTDVAECAGEGLRPLGEARLKGIEEAQIVFGAE
jgi:hypothetical protein